MNTKLYAGVAFAALLLIWAGGIVWAAVDIAGSSSTKPASNDAAAMQNGQTSLTDPLGDPVDAADLKTIANLVDQ